MKKDWFKKYDFLNIPTSLSYKNEYFYETNIGAALSIIFFLIIITLTSYELLLLFKKSSFTLISNQFTDISQTIDFSETPFLFQMTSSKGKNIDMDNKLFVIKAYNMEQTITINKNGTKEKKLTNTELELEKCDIIYSNKSEYSELNLSNYICIKPGQNLTAYGLLGDMNNAFKGIRVYINKCSGSHCYNTSIIDNKLNNARFRISYLSLSSNMFYLNSENIKYQLFTKYCSLSTTVLKKIVFTFDIGRFHLYNNILFENKISFNYILGNDNSIDFDIDIDSESIFKEDEFTISYIGLHYGGNIIETRKKVQNIFESLSIIGNIFNIILTLFKVINCYYANKILFVDIFQTVFFSKESINNKNIIHTNSFISFKKANSLSKKKNLDISDEISFKYNNNKIKCKSSLNNKAISLTGDNSKGKRKSKSHIENNENAVKLKLIYYYLLPLWFLKKKKTLNSIYIIKNRICEYFSIEKFNDLVKFKEGLEDKSLKSKVNKTEIIKINDNICEKNDLNGSKNKFIQILK